MAFLPPLPLRLPTPPAPRLTSLPRRRHLAHPRPRASTAPTSQSPPPSQTPSDSTPAPSAITIPSSLSSASIQATTAAKQAFSTGLRRLFIEVDLSAGDATYTLLKSTLPLVQLLFPLLDIPQLDTQPPVHIILPDAGAAALARRDFDDIPPHATLCGLEQAQIDPHSDGGVIIVAPRASDVERLSSVVQQAADLRVVIVNPDLVDMGVTGLSLNARRLRQSLIDTFETVYFLKTFEWGVLLRAYPGAWGVWVDAVGTEIGFRLVTEVEKKPGSEEIEELLEADGDVDGGRVGPFEKFRRFLNVYMKG